MRKQAGIRRVVVATVAATFASLTLVAQQPKPIPTFVIHNAKVFTADPAQPYAEAIAIADKKIIAVGTNDEVLSLAKRQTYRIDAGGRRVIPGFNDAHVHFGNGPESFPVERGMDPKWEDLAPAIANAVDETYVETWITATIGPKVLLDPNVNGNVLDAIAGKHKVLLRAWTGHGMILSKAAREALGMPSGNAPDPLGGWYGRDAQGNIDGRAFEYAQFALERRYAELASDEQMIAELRALGLEAVNLGITTLQVMPMIDAERFRKLVEAADIPVWVRRIDFVTDPTETGPGKASALKFVLDGTPVERNAAVRKAYADGTSGRENFSDLTPLIRRAAAARQQVLFHAAGDRTIASLLQALSKANNVRRPRIEHGDGLQRDLFDLARKTGVTVVQNPSHFPSCGSYPKDGEYCLMATLLEQKIPVAIGSDGPLNPFLNIAFATARRDKPREALSREQAVAAYTRGSAYAEMREGDKGRIAVGMVADLAMLSSDILSAEVGPDALPGVLSVLTMVNGVVKHLDSSRVPSSTGVATLP